MRLQYTHVYIKEPRPLNGERGFAVRMQGYTTTGQSAKGGVCQRPLFRQPLHDRLRRGEAWLMGDADVNAAGGAGQAEPAPGRLAETGMRLAERIGEHFDILEADQRADSGAERLHDGFLGREPAGYPFRPARFPLRQRLPLARSQDPLQEALSAGAIQQAGNPLQLQYVMPDTVDHEPLSFLFGYAPFYSVTLHFI